MSNTAFLTICLAWGAVCSIWAALFAAQVVARRRGLMLRPLWPRATLGVEWPNVTVLIAARDEADTIESCLRHVLAQDYPRLRVVLVDDRSSDATGAVARRMAAEDPRLHVLRIDCLPDGWLGKSHALSEAARGSATGADWLLFIDADCTMHPSAVRTAVAEAWRRRADALTLWPRSAAVTFWEHMLIPLCAGIIALWFGSAELGRSPRRAAFANGQFLLIRTSTYVCIGGHAAVRHQIIEDVPLAEHARDAGVEVHVASGRDLVAVRMYRSLAQVVDGWSRIYVGALRSAGKLVLSILWLLLGSLLPHVAAAVVVIHLTRDGRLDRQSMILALLCVQHLVLVYVVSVRFWAMGRCRRVYLWLYPVSVAVVIAILTRALWLMLVRRQIRWRDTSYAIGARGTIIG